MFQSREQVLQLVAYYVVLENKKLVLIKSVLYIKQPSSFNFV